MQCYCNENKQREKKENEDQTEKTEIKRNNGSQQEDIGEEEGIEKNKKK